LNQIGVFATLANQIVKAKGIDCVTEDDIFSNEQVKKILGLDAKGPFSFTLVSNQEDFFEPETI